MKKISTIKELCEFIWYLENKYNLLDFEIDGIKVWQYKRMDIYYNLAQKLNILTQPHGIISKKEKIFKFFLFVKNSIFYNPIFHNNKIDKLIIPHSRKKNYNGEEIDIYTHFFIENLIKENKTFIELEPPYLGSHTKNNKKDRYFNDYIILFSNLLSIFVNINNNNLKTINLCNKEIEETISKEFNLNFILEKAAKKFKIENILYFKLLKKLSPKEIYIVVSYSGYAPLIKAAKKLKIEVIEFQHGTFSEYHLGYSYPERKKELDYFPNKFLVWSQYWKDLISFPILKENIIVKNFEYFENEKNKYKNILKNKNQALVISQGAISSKIAEYILERWDYFEKFKIVYKLHPGEIASYKNNLPLVELLKKENVELDLNTDLYSLFMSSEYQIGVFSTAIYEGIDFNCKTILLNLPGIEYMTKFIIYNKIEVLK